MDKREGDLLVVGGDGENFDRFQVQAVNKNGTIFQVDAKAVDTFVFGFK